MGWTGLLEIEHNFMVHYAGGSMTKLALDDLKRYQANTFHLQPKLTLKSPADAVDFVNERGFVFFWPVKGMTLPSLWAAVAGDRPVADEHDDPGHVTWGWKDSMLDQHVWYYGRVVKRKNAFISHELLPYFYALSPNYGSPEDDFEDQYQMGHLTLETKLIFDTLIEKGAMDTINLRKESHLAGQASSAPFERAIGQLQMDFRILPVGIADVGSWHYAFTYDLTHRQYPDLLEQARNISESQARNHLVLSYLRSVGAARERDIASLFLWDAAVTHRVVEGLRKREEILTEIELENSKDAWVGTLEIGNTIKE